MLSSVSSVLTVLTVSLQAVERVLFPHLPAYWANLQAVLDDYTVSNAQVKADGHKVYGAILVSRNHLDQLDDEHLGNDGYRSEGHRWSGEDLHPFDWLEQPNYGPGTIRGPRTFILVDLIKNRRCPNPVLM